MSTKSLTPFFNDLHALMEMSSFSELIKSSLNFWTPLIDRSNLAIDITFKSNNWILFR